MGPLRQEQSGWPPLSLHSLPIAEIRIFFSHTGGPCEAPSSPGPWGPASLASTIPPATDLYIYRTALSNFYVATISNQCRSFFRGSSLFIIYNHNCWLHHWCRHCKYELLHLSHFIRICLITASHVILPGYKKVFSSKSQVNDKLALDIACGFMLCRAVFIYTNTRCDEWWWSVANIHILYGFVYSQKKRFNSIATYKPNLLTFGGRYIEALRAFFFSTLYRQSPPEYCQPSKTHYYHIIYPSHTYPSNFG